MDFKSEGMNRIFSKMDRYILELEEDVKFFSRKADKLEKEKNKRIIEDFNNSQLMMENTLNTILNKPKLDNISAILLLKIKEMQDIEDIHKYVDEIIKTGVIAK